MHALIASSPASRPFDIAAFGEPMVEFNQTGQGDGRIFLQGFGGDTSNFAISAARQGARVAYISAVGDDLHGRMLRQLWQQEGVDQRWVSTSAEAFTGFYFVTHDESGHHFEFFRRGSAASRIHAAALPLEASSSARVCHLSGISLAISEVACEAGFAWMQAARASGARVSFDTNLRLKLWDLDRARQVLRRAIEQSDICLPSYDDLVAITGIDADEGLLDYCLDLGVQIVALKLGHRGAWVASPAERYRLAPHPCQPLDATGAGDTFGGAFVARLLAGDGLQQAGRYANVAAALSTEGYGAVDPIAHRDRVVQALQGAQLQ